MTTREGSLDIVITNVTIIDAKLGVVKADVGIKDDKIVGIGKAGNPNVMHGVDPDLVTGPSTDAISGEHLILTAAGIDGHVHLISPQQAYASLSNGITTLIGGGVGPTDGTNGTTITSGRWNIERMLQSVEGLPINVGLLGKGNCSVEEPIEEQIEAGACGLKIHETGIDTGSQSDALSWPIVTMFRLHPHRHPNEGGLWRILLQLSTSHIHTLPPEGAGGGPAPDLLRVASMPTCSLRRPTHLPYGSTRRRAVRYDMCATFCIQDSVGVAFAESRVRPATQSAENGSRFGLLSMVSSDSQAWVAWANRL